MSINLLLSSVVCFFILSQHAMGAPFFDAAPLTRGLAHFNETADFYNRFSPGFWTKGAPPVRPYWPLYCETYLGIMSPPLDIMGTFLEQQAVPNYLIDYRIQDRGFHHHITIIRPPEMGDIPPVFQSDYDALQQYAYSMLSGSYVKVLGVGRRFEKVQSPDGNSLQDKWDVVYFAVVEWEAAQYFRESIGLPRNDFHITLGYNHFDLFDVRKDASSLIYHLKPQYQQLCPFRTCFR